MIQVLKNLKLVVIIIPYDKTKDEIFYDNSTASLDLNV